MKKLFLLLLFFPTVTGFCQENLLDKFSRKVKDRVEQRTDEGMDKAIDKAEQGVKKEANTPKKKSSDQERKAIQSQKPGSTFESYSHYDFIPGENIMYAEDFSQDVVGEFPLKWSTNNQGQTVTIKEQPGQWLRLMQDGHFVSPYIKTLPENFTAEFDAVLHLPENVNNTSYADFVVRLMSVQPGDEKARQFFNNAFDSKADIRFTIQPYTDEHSTINLESTSGGNQGGYFRSENKEQPKFAAYLEKTIHFAIWVQKERFRLWINGEKVYDLPQAVPTGATFNRLEFQTGGSSYDVGYYVSNIRVAQGTPDMRSKLLTEGKLVTTGILFDVNSDHIRPESTGVLQEIARTLKENSSLKVTIVGHTDSDGDDAKNLDLSKRRAAAVKTALSTQFSISEGRMQTDGKGEGQPVADNSTKEGKAKNRRVEFIKQ
ncbi:OmpA family protein [Chitinophaga eiseniae]|uniref:OmpA family protein n=1 Tax=Chitinophaga eiseniae TaxID=634771 RepID=A0A847SGW2_9BACT|nr:OmpA family protein [Chitinophaga eiseniae]NLR82500.1 OmpA family protein [Chitinophaga eiseniae]